MHGIWLRWKIMSPTHAHYIYSIQLHNCVYESKRGGGGRRRENQIDWKRLKSAHGIALHSAEINLYVCFMVVYCLLLIHIAFYFCAWHLQYECVLVCCVEKKSWEMRILYLKICHVYTLSVPCVDIHQNSWIVPVHPNMRTIKVSQKLDANGRELCDAYLEAFHFGQTEVQPYAL